MSDHIANREKYESYIESQKEIYEMNVLKIKTKYRQKIKVLKENESNIKPQQYPPFWWYEEKKLDEEMQQIIQMFQKKLDNNINPIYVKLWELDQQEKLDQQGDPHQQGEPHQQGDPHQQDEPLMHPRIQMVKHHMDPDENEYLYILKNKQLKQQQQQQQEQP